MLAVVCPDDESVMKVRKARPSRGRWGAGYNVATLSALPGPPMPLGGDLEALYIFPTSPLLLVFRNLSPSYSTKELGVLILPVWLFGDRANENYTLEGRHSEVPTLL